MNKMLILIKRVNKMFRLSSHHKKGNNKKCKIRYNKIISRANYKRMKNCKQKIRNNNKIKLLSHNHNSINRSK
jgi:hypothetical protein